MTVTHSWNVKVGFGTNDNSVGDPETGAAPEDVVPPHANEAESFNILLEDGRPMTTESGDKVVKEGIDDR